MRLVISKNDNGRDGADLRFRVFCQLEVTSEERRRMLRFGAYPLTRPTPGPIDPMKPVPTAVLTDAQFQDFVTLTGTGLVYESDDVRVAEDFIMRLHAAVTQLWDYWVIAEQFQGQVPDQVFERPKPQVP